MTRHENLEWRTSSYSDNMGNCVAIAALPGGQGLAVRDSKNPDGGIVTFTPASWSAFIVAVKDSELD